MKSPSPTRPTDRVVTPTDARQASPKTSNFRVLTTSLVLAVAVGLVLVGAFWFATPDGVEGVPERTGVTQGENTPASPPVVTDSTITSPSATEPASPPVDAAPVTPAPSEPAVTPEPSTPEPATPAPSTTP